MLDRELSGLLEYTNGQMQSMLQWVYIAEYNDLCFNIIKSSISTNTINSSVLEYRSKDNQLDCKWEFSFK